MDNFDNKEHLIGVCTVCGTAIYSEKDVGEPYPQMKCKKCKDKEIETERKKIKEEKEKKVRNLEQAKSRVKMTLIIPGIIVTVIAVIVCIISIKLIWAVIPLSLLIYMTVVEFLWGAEPVATIMEFALVPPKRTFGVIFELSVDGCISFIITKILLGIVAVLLSIACSVFGFVIALLCAAFAFPFYLVRAIRNPDKLNFLI